jgi:hypothetical protein
MKYSEFLQLSDVLEEQGSSISEFMFLNDELFEAGETELNTEKTSFVGRRISRWRNIKNKLNKVGKDTQKQLMDKVLSKYFPPMLDKEKQVAEKVKAYKKQDVKELEKLVKTHYDTIKTEQKTQLQNIHKAIKGFLDNVTQRMNTKIESSKMTDKNKARMKNYWLLLLTQISMNASTYMINERGKVIEDIYGGNKETSKNAKNYVNAEEAQVVQNNKVAADKLKTTIKTEEEQIETETEQTTTKLEVGKKYNLIDEETKKKYPVEITKIEGDKITYKTEDGKSWELSKDAFNKRSPELIAPEKPAEVKPAEQPVATEKPTEQTK